MNQYTIEEWKLIESALGDQESSILPRIEAAKQKDDNSHLEIAIELNRVHDLLKKVRCEANPGAVFEA